MAECADVAGTASLLLLHGATVIDTSATDARTSAADVLVEGGHIAGVVPRGSAAAAGAVGTSATCNASAAPDIPTPNGAQVVDVSGCFVMPGLINAHAHLFSSGALANPEPVMHAGDPRYRTPEGQREFFDLAAGFAREELASGVTTLRCAGDFFFQDVALREAVESGVVMGPHLLVSGPPLTVPGGHGDGPIAFVSDKPTALATYADRILDGGADFVKVFTTGGVVDAPRRGEPGEVKMTREQTEAIVATVHARGRKVSSHAESSAGVLLALRSGVDFIEHGASLDAEVVELFRCNGAVLVQTLTPGVELAQRGAEANLPEVAQYNANVVLEQMLAGLQTALEYDIPIALGNDASCAFVPHDCFWHELELTEQLLGLGRARMLHMATAGNAELLGLGDKTGRVASGCSADLIVLRENPLEDLRALRHPVMVVCRGAIYDG